DYRGSGPAGLWELLDGQTEVGITVHRIEAQLDTGAVLRTATIPIERYDTLTSLHYKAHVAGDDLLAQTVSEIAQGTAAERVQTGKSRVFRFPKPYQLRRYEKQIASQRPAYRPRRTHSWLELAARTLVPIPYIIVRNWFRRRSGSFPVIVLHLDGTSDSSH